MGQRLNHVTCSAAQDTELKCSHCPDVTGHGVKWWKMKSLPWEFLRDFYRTCPQHMAMGESKDTVNQSGCWCVAWDIWWCKEQGQKGSSNHLNLGDLGKGLNILTRVDGMKKWGNQLFIYPKWRSYRHREIHKVRKNHLDLEPGLRWPFGEVTTGCEQKNVEKWEQNA